MNITTDKNFIKWLQAAGLNPNSDMFASFLSGLPTTGPTTVPTTGSDKRAAIDGPLTMPSGVNWQAPLELRSEMATTSGRIQVQPGFYRSTDPSVAVFTCNAGSTPIDFLPGVFIAHAGRGVSGGGGTNVSMVDSTFFGLNPTVDNQPRERAIQISNGTNVDLQYISMQAAGGIYVELWSGNHTAAQTVKIRNVRSRNVIGGGGSSSGQGSDVYRSVIQIKDVHTDGMLIQDIESYNQANLSRVEDQINLFRCGGRSSVNPMLLNRLYLHGSYPFPATSSTYSGAALSVDGSSNTDYNETQSGWILATNVYGISNCNAAFNIAVGNNIIYDTLYGINAGYLDDGTTRQASSYAGAWSGDFYGTGVSKTNFIKNATMGFVRTKDTIARLDFSPDTTAGSLINPISLPDPITMALQQQYFLKWRDTELNANGQTCGSRITV